MGLPMGTVVPRLAEIKAGLDASDGSYGSAIALGGLGALLGNYAGSRLIHRYGSRTVARATFYLILAANVSNALAPTIGVLSLVAFSGGLFYATTNIAVNNQGVLVEQHIKRSFMPMAHGFWSVGAMTAALLSSLAAPYCTPLQALTFTAAVSSVGFLVLTASLLPDSLDDRPSEDPSQLARHEPIPAATRRFLVAIAIGLWLGLFAELSVSDWSSVLLREDFGIPIGPNGYGFTAFMVTQMSMRLILPRWIDRFGLDVMVRRCAIVGGVAYIALLVAAQLVHTQSTTAALVLMCLAYVGMAIGVAAMPAAFTTAAGGIPGLPTSRALFVTGAIAALTNTVARTGFSHVAQAITLPIALVIPGVALVGAGLMTAVLHPERGAAHAIMR